MTLDFCRTKGDTLVSRFFGNVVPRDEQMQVIEVKSVDHLGDVYETNISWVVHESLEHEDLAAPALAKIERIIVEVTPMGVGKDRSIYRQRLRCPALKLQLAERNVAT
eukprot:3963377-Pleurochrysis_carterae.AAC.1